MDDLTGRHPDFKFPYERASQCPECGKYTIGFDKQGADALLIKHRAKAHGAEEKR